jgi:thiol:disulfide interchange protein
VATTRNRAPLAGLLLAVVAVASYFTVVTPELGPRVPWLRDVPVLNFALLAVALWLAWRGVRRGRWPARLAGAGTVALTALFAFYVYGLSSWLPPAEGAPRVGQVAPAFTLTDDHGHALALDSLRGAPVVLVFYRGFW